MHFLLALFLIPLTTAAPVCPHQASCHACIKQGCIFVVDFDGLGSCSETKVSSALIITKVAHCGFYQSAREMGLTTEIPLTSATTNVVSGKETSPFFAANAPQKIDLFVITTQPPPPSQLPTSEGGSILPIPTPSSSTLAPQTQLKPIPSSSTTSVSLSPLFSAFPSVNTPHLYHTIKPTIWPQTTRSQASFPSSSPTLVNLPYPYSHASTTKEPIKKGIQSIAAEQWTPTILLDEPKDYFTCPNEFRKETLRMKMERSACRSYLLSKRYLRSEDDDDWRLFTLANPMKRQVRECRYRQWARVKCPRVLD